MKKTMILIVVLLLTAALMYGCSSNPDKAGAEPQETSSMDTDTTTENEETNASETENTDSTEKDKDPAQSSSTSSKESLPLPENFPKDLIPLPEGTIITKIDELDETSWMIDAEIKDFDAAVELYDSTLPSKGELSGKENYRNVDRSTEWHLDMHIYRPTSDSPLIMNLYVTKSSF